MSRSIQNRRGDRENVRHHEIRQRRFGRRRSVAPSCRTAPAPCVIGLPIPVSVPTVRDVRWRYCARYDEQPAAKLGKSLLRLGICSPGDWTGSAVDFVERGFKGFCKANGMEAARRIWYGELEIMDQVFDMNERERNDARAEMGDEPVEFVFLVGVFTSAASIPIGPSLAILEPEHQFLPAAFYAVLRHCLSKWMDVYDYENAHECAEMGMIDVEESELADSIYPQVAASVPDCLRDRLKMNPHRGLALLRTVQPHLRGTVPRQLIGQLLELSERSRGDKQVWPGQLARQIPGLGDYLEDCDGIGPGCLLHWYEGDPINACFDDDMTYVGQNGPITPSILRVVTLSNSERATDTQVQRLFDYIGALVRSLAAAAKLVETIRDIDDEHLRKDRLKSGLPTEPGPPGVRDE
jgi:hypothetical protein